MHDIDAESFYHVERLPCSDKGWSSHAVCSILFEKAGALLSRKIRPSVDDSHDFGMRAQWQIRLVLIANSFIDRLSDLGAVQATLQCSMPQTPAHSTSFWSIAHLKSGGKHEHYQTS